MEEKKLKEEKKISYERLQEICGDLSQRLQMAQQKIAEIDAANTIHRLNFLFKVLEYYSLFDAEFTDKCIKEIQDILTIPEEEETKESHDA